MAKEEVKKYWQKIGGGGLTLADGRRIKSGDKFYEFESRISPAFRKSLRLLNDGKTTEDTSEGTVVKTAAGDAPKKATVKKTAGKTVSRTK